MKLIAYLFLFCVIFEFPNKLNKVVMIINVIRHGARTPNKILPELEKYFPNIGKGKLTIQGLRQMILLGKAKRKEYLETKSTHFFNLLDINKISKQFLLISSPNPRAVESGIGYVSGLFPEYMYSINNIAEPDQQDYPIPPIMKNKAIKVYNNTFNFIIEDRENDMMFHSRKCKLPNDLLPLMEEKNKIYHFLTLNEKQLIFYFYKKYFNITLGSHSTDTFTEKLARSLYTAIRCLNFSYKNKIIPIPKHIHLILKKLFVHYLFFQKTHNDKETRMTSSPILDHMLNFFDHKVMNMDEKLDFYELSSFNYTDLKFVTYSGHDYNFVGLIKNLLDFNTIMHYINNLEMYQKLFIIPFASSIDFHLVKNEYNEFFIKIYLNGEELFENVRSYRERELILYDKQNGIPYKIFKKVIKSRIYPDYANCVMTRKNKLK